MDQKQDKGCQATTVVVGPARSDEGRTLSEIRQALAQLPSGDRPVALWFVDAARQLNDLRMSHEIHREYSIPVNKEGLRRFMGIDIHEVYPFTLKPQELRGLRWWQRTPGVWLEFADGRVWALGVR